MSFLGGLLLLSGAHPAAAGLDLSWRMGGAARGDSVITLDCDNPDSVVVLYGCFQVPDTLPRVAALTIYLDVVTESPALPGFWRVEPEGCNRRGIVVTKNWSEEECPGTENPWEGTTITGISGDPQYDKNRTRTRIVAAIARSIEDPVKLVPGVNYFGFQIRIFTDLAKEAGGSCDGCRTPVAIRWTSATLEQPMLAGKHTPPVYLTGRGRGSDRVALNGPRAATLKDVLNLEPPLNPAGKP